MHDDLNFKISQLLDHELEKEEALQLMRRIDEEPELEKTMHSFDAVSQALKNEVFLPVSNDFVNRVKEQIQSEPVYFLPDKKRIRRRYMQMTAAVASVAIVAVLATQGMNFPLTNNTPTLVVNEVRGVYQKDSNISHPQSGKNGISENPSALMVAENNSPQDNLDKFNQANTSERNDKKSSGVVSGNRNAREINTVANAGKSHSVDSRFNDYLHAHSGNMFSSGTNYQAFAEVANFEQ